MRLAVGILGIVGLALVPPAFGADEPWGAAMNGLRLGITLDPAASGPELRVRLQNVGEANLDILIGHQVGKGTAVDLKFFATAPDGKQRECFEINSFTPVAGLVLPAVIELDPGPSMSCTSR